LPEISTFPGISIVMRYREHAPPHFHAKYGSFEVLPRRALSHVLEWTSAHRDELMADWALAEQRKPLQQIEPLE